MGNCLKRSTTDDISLLRGSDSVRESSSDQLGSSAAYQVSTRTHTLARAHTHTLQLHIIFIYFFILINYSYLQSQLPYLLTFHCR